MRIAERVHVALASVDVTTRDVEQRDSTGHVDMPCAAATDFRVPRTVEQERHPARLEIEPDERPHICVSQLEHEARLRFDEMWILVALSDVADGNPVSADFLRDVGKVCRARHYFQLS